jgi:cell shape-determining protein MreD
MLSRNEWLLKWGLYTWATLLGIFVQGLVLQKITLWGVIPFLYPVLVAVTAAYEGPVSGALYGLVLGIVCDLLLPAALPCLYTLIFPVVGFASAQIAWMLQNTGIFSALVATAAAFFLTDAFCCLVLWLQGKSVWPAGLTIMAKEFCVTAVLVLPVSMLFRTIYRRTH